MRKYFGFTFILLSLTTLASAQIPTSGNIFAGYSYYNTNLGADRQSLNGWEGSVEAKFFFPFIGIVGDFSANYGSLAFNACPVLGPCGTVSANSHVENLLVGPRVS